MVMFLYLGDGGALKSLPAVDPSVTARHALSAVAQQHDILREAGGVGEAEVQGGWIQGLIPRCWTRALAALMGRRGSGEDAHQHVEGEEDLR